MLLLDIAGGRGIEPMVLLLLALVLDAAIGDPRWLQRVVPHPVRLIGAAIAFLDRKLNRDKRSDAIRRLRGVVCVALVVGGCAALGWGVTWLTRNHDFGWIVELALLTMLVAQRDLYDHVRRVRRALDHEGLEAARAAVSMIVGRDPARLDGHGVARAAIESCAENYNDGVVAPVFWYVLFGMPGLLAFKAASTLDSMIGHMSPRHRAFGFAAAKLDDLLGLAPARLSGLYLVAAAAFTPGAHPWRALRVMWRDAGRHRSPNAGWPEAATAGALDLALAGPRAYPERTVNDPWLGDGTARAGGRDIARALRLYLAACLINALVAGLVAILRLEGVYSW